MAAGNVGQILSSKDMTNEDLHEFSNIFSSEFNKSNIHDRVLCFQIIENEEFDNKGNSEDDESQYESEIGIALFERGPHSTWSKHTKSTTAMAGSIKSSTPLTRSWNVGSSSSSRRITRSWSWSSTTAMVGSNKYDENMENSNARETFEQREDEEEPRNIVGEEQKLQYETEESQETTTEDQNKETRSTSKDSESKTSKTADDENKSIVSKLFVHSQWLAVQSPYFKALFYSGMKETYSKEVVMKIYEHEFQAHLHLIEAMYKLDVLNDKDYRLVVQVLVLANKYDVRHVIKKCKYVLLSTTPSLEMCEYILREIKHLSDMADIYDMLEKFLVKEFTPIDKTWTMEKFSGLSEAALRLLLGSDNLGSRSENTIFVALMNWVHLNVSWLARDECDLLDVVRFEFMSVDFLYDEVQDHLVARRMPGFDKYLLKGLAYHGFSQIRREQLEPKPKKRRLVEDAGPTFSWVIEDKLVKKLTKFPGVPVYSNEFWFEGYSMQLRLVYAKDLSKCRFNLEILDLAGEACVYASFRVKSNLFGPRTVQTTKRLFTASHYSWGKGIPRCNAAQTGKGYTIDVWVEIA